MRSKWSELDGYGQDYVGLNAIAGLAMLLGGMFICLIMGSFIWMILWGPMGGFWLGMSVAALYSPVFRRSGVPEGVR